MAKPTDKDPWWAHHSPDCGTKYRGCAPDCPKDARDCQLGINAPVREIVKRRGEQRAKLEIEEPVVLEVAASIRRIAEMYPRGNCQRGLHNAAVILERFGLTGKPS